MSPYLNKKKRAGFLRPADFQRSLNAVLRRCGVRSNWSQRASSARGQRQRTYEDAASRTDEEGARRDWSRAAIAEPCCVEVDREATFSNHVHDDPVLACARGHASDNARRNRSRTRLCTAVEVQERPTSEIAGGRWNRREHHARRRLR